MTRNIFIVAVLLGFVSCNSKPAGVQSPGKNDTAGHMTMPAKPDLKSLTYDYKKDPACGMPLKSGLEDTTHYKGKLYGFCSKECKEAFLKDPASYVAQIK